MKFLFYLLIFSFSVSFSYGQLAPAALGFDGVDDLVTIPSNAQYAIGTGDFTVEFWFRSATVAGGAPYSSTLFELGSGFNGLSVFLTNGRINVKWGNVGTGNTTGGPDYRDSICHHFAYRRTGNVLTYLIDGLVCPIIITANSLTGTGPILLGSWNGSGGKFKGTMKEVRFWKRSLTQTEIINGFNQVQTASATQLVGYWRLNGTSGQTVADYSSINNGGVLGSTANVETSDPSFTTACPACTPPAATISPITQTVLCAGDSALLTANAGAGFTYQWYKDGLAIAGATNMTYYAKLDGLHYVRIKNAAGCEAYSVSKDVVVPSVRYLNLISNKPVVNGSTCLNAGSATLNAAGGNTFLWYKNGISTGYTGFSISIPNNLQDQGLYSCRIIAGQCTVITNAINVKNFTSTITTPWTNFCSSGTTISMTNNYGSNNGQFFQNGSQIGLGSSASTSISGPVQYIENNAALCPVAINSNTLNIQAGAPPSLMFIPAPAYSFTIGMDVIDTCLNYPGYIHDLWVAGFNPAEVGPQFSWYGPISLSGYQTPNVPASVNGIYSCAATNMCGTGLSTQVCVRVLNAASPPLITGNSTGCPSVILETGNFYDSYQWKLNGIDIAGATSYSHVATQAGTYTCLISNSCGSLLSAPKTITLNGPGATISTIQPYNLCNGPKTLTATPNGYTYKWLKNNVLIAGATTQTYVASTGGSYRAIVTNACKSDTSNTITLGLETTVPVSPGAMTGLTRVCPGSTGIVYSIPAVATAFTYQWIIPAGMTATTPIQGAGVISVTVNVSASFVSGDVQVRAGNACGWGPYRIKTVRTIIPSSPGTVTGPTYGVCNSTQSYSIAAVSQATTYLWVAPPGANIVSGQGTTAVTVSYNSTFGIDTLRVSAGNSCAYGPVRKVVVRGKPQNPGAITGPSTACNGQTGVVYSIAPIYGANSYTWNKPTGSTITNGQNTLSATITFGPNSGNVTVKAVNGCGISGASTKAITINCREGELAPGGFEIYPNPSAEAFILDGTFSKDGVFIQVFDMTGKLKFSQVVREQFNFGEELVPGLYIVKLKFEGSEQNIRIVKI